MPRFNLAIVIGITVAIFITSQILLEVYYEDELWTVFMPSERHDYNNLFKEITQPVVVWWAPLGGPDIPGHTRQCGQHSCYFTNDHHFRHHPNFKAFMFYGSNLKLSKLPLPRNASSVLWALLHEESPRNNAVLSHLPVLSLFNYTATFSRHSSFPLTTQYLSSLQVLTDMKYFISTQEKNRLQSEEDIAPLMYLQSDCSTPNNRDSYVVELAKYMKVDSYGDCLHNKDLPEHLQSPNSLDTMMSDDLLHLVAKYKFILALENGICDDYVTEKLWRPLISGAVPVYIGSPSVSDWLPNKKSAVLGAEFVSPKALAEHLIYLNANDDEYDNYLSHKLQGELTNTRLKQTMEDREWDTDWNTEQVDFIDGFGCYVCKMAQNSSSRSIATLEHYACPMPKSIVSNTHNYSNYWLDTWFHGKCEAELTRSFIDLGIDEIPYEQYEEELQIMVLNHECSHNFNK